MYQQYTDIYFWRLYRLSQFGLFNVVTFE